MSRGCAALVLAALVSWMFHAHASAQTLEEAESELAAGNADRALAIARSLIDAGTSVGSDLAPIYRVVGVAAATAGDGDAAREAFTRWLALEPEGRLDRSLSDEIRSPFLEARGFWASQPARLGATATLRADALGIEVHVVDPASMVARVRMRWRTGAGAWTDVVRAPAETVSIDVAGLDAPSGVDCVITFLDESGNRIWHDGTDDAPLHLGATEAIASDRVVVALPPETSGPPSPAADATGFHVGAVIAGVVAVGALIGAAVFHADRERVAGVYNGDGSGCTGSGTTRGEVCGPQRSAISADETAAIALYAVGGAAAVVALVLAIVAPTGHADADAAALACGGGPGTVGIACGGTF